MAQSLYTDQQIPVQEIIDLYRSGMSQKDISTHLSVGLKKIRAILRKEGFNTTAYLRIPPEHEEVIHTLLRSGISYRAVSELTDISFHVVRELAQRHPDPCRRRAYRKLLSASSNVRDQEFLTRFLAGESFCVISVDLKLSEEEILRCCCLIDIADLARHSESLRARLKGEALNQCHERSLARKYGISTSVVKAYLNS